MHSTNKGTSHISISKRTKDPAPATPAHFFPFPSQAAWGGVTGEECASSSQGMPAWGKRHLSSRWCRRNSPSKFPHVLRKLPSPLMSHQRRFPPTLWIIQVKKDMIWVGYFLLLFLHLFFFSLPSPLPSVSSALFFLHHLFICKGHLIPMRHN